MLGGVGGGMGENVWKNYIYISMYLWMHGWIEKRAENRDSFTSSGREVLSMTQKQFVLQKDRWNTNTIRDEICRLLVGSSVYIYICSMVISISLIYT